MEWAQVLVVIAANMAAFMWSRKEANDFHRQTISLIMAMKDEMKDFHARLEKIDMEFRMRLLAIEEKRK